MTLDHIVITDDGKLPGCAARLCRSRRMCVGVWQAGPAALDSRPRLFGRRTSLFGTLRRKWESGN
jgi:hypothetical protein